MNKPYVYEIEHIESGKKYIGCRYAKGWHFDNCNVLTGVKKQHPKVTCPHCGKVGGSNVMKRDHFDNCKYKESK